MNDNTINGQFKWEASSFRTRHKVLNLYHKTAKEQSLKMLKNPLDAAIASKHPKNPDIHNCQIDWRFFTAQHAPWQVQNFMFTTCEFTFMRPNYRAFDPLKNKQTKKSLVNQMINPLISKECVWESRHFWQVTAGFGVCILIACRLHMLMQANRHTHANELISAYLTILKNQLIWNT